MTDSNAVNNDGTLVSQSETLTLDAIAQEAGIGKPALVRYLGEPETRALMEPVGNPPRYPRTSLPLFRAIAEGHKIGTIKPKTAAAMLRQRFAIRNKADDAAEGLALQPDSRVFGIRFSESETRNAEGEAARMVAALEGIAAVQQQAAQVRDTRLLTTEQAAERLQMSPSWVRANVPCIRLGRRVRYRLSDLAVFISESETGR